MNRFLASASGKVKVRVVLVCCVLGYFAFFILGQTGIIPNLPARKVIATHRERALSQARLIEGLRTAAGEAVATSQPWDEVSVQNITGVPVTARNTAVMHIENMEDATRNLKEPRAMPVCFCDPYEVTSCISLARTGRWPGNERVTFDSSSQRMEAMFQTLDQLHYLIVIRKSFYVGPEFTQPGSFTSGTYHADAFLFELPTGRMLGSFEFGATSSRSIQATLPKGESIPNERLEVDLSSNAASAFQGRLEGFLPTVAREKETW